MDQKLFKQLIDELSAHASDLLGEKPLLIAQLAEVIKERQSIFQTGGTASIVPATRLAIESLKASDATWVSAQKGVDAVFSETKQVHHAWGNQLKEAVDEIQKSLAEIRSTARRDVGLERIMTQVLDSADLGNLAFQFNFRTFTVLNHLMLAALHDANASYLDRKGYAKTLALESSIKILEGAGHDAIHLGLIVGAGAAGIALPHILAIGTGLALVSVFRDINKSPTKEKGERWKAAMDQYERIFVLQQEQEDIARGVAAVEKFLRDVNKSAEDTMTKLASMVHKLRAAKSDIDGVMRIADDLLRLKKLADKINGDRLS